MAHERKPWVGGNWKCNGTVASVTALCSEFKKQSFDPNAVDVVIFPAAVHVSLAREKLPSNFYVGLQNSSATSNGAFTGEVSAEMIRDLGPKWVLAGHSERRQYFGETDAVVAKKVEKLQASSVLHTVLCFGETLCEREAGETFHIIKTQLEAACEKIEDWQRIVIAYEPVWAIGTGVVASPEQAQEVHQYLRMLVKAKAGEEVAKKLRVVYGGSVNEENCVQLMLQPDIDGLLVGGASLKKGFLNIISAAANHSP